MSQNPYESPSEESRPETPLPQSTRQGMTAREAYGVTVRGIGLLQLCTSLFYLATIPAYAMGFEDTEVGDRFYNLSFGTMAAIAGVLLIALADGIVTLSYPRDAGP